MQMLKQYMIRCCSVSLAALAVLASAPSQAAELNLSDTPLFLAPSVPPLNMLVVGRDHKLYYEAYNDASDLNGDGKIDVGYKGYLPNPTQQQPNNGGIDYYGYFDSYKCYTYDSGTNRFNPVRLTATKACGGSGEWSGDYLNYLTMSRIDALRKVLYGGKRAVDTDSLTVLVRSHIPMDAHSWGKEYSSDAPFDIRQYTPFSRPAAGQRHLFANTTPNVGIDNWANNNGPPLLRVLLSRTYRIWEWVSKESPVAGTIVSPAGRSDETVTIDHDYQVRVRVCASAELIATNRNSENCKSYPNGRYKPTGLLHEFGENDSMMFGLLTGSYTANKSGGVLRKNVGSFRDEVNENNGTWNTGVSGIVKTLDSMRVGAYTRYTANGGTSYDCGLPAMARGAPVDGTCRMWGNPVAEMMYETLRYYYGLSPEPAFTTTYGGSNTGIETTLGLPRASWRNPYAANRYPTCAKPFQTVMADINNSYDSDQLPGSYFPLEVGSNALSGTQLSMNVNSLADQITNGEEASSPGSVRGQRFIGQSGALYDGAPTPKEVTSLGQIRGLAPEEPTKQGSYYPASVAYHGYTNPANPSTPDGRVQTFAVALASPLPRIEIPVGAAGSNRFITLVPFAKSIRYNDEINRDPGQFQPTNQIVDFYVENIADDRRSGTFQVNFEDVEAGNDHDMDAIVRYTYRMLDDDTVQVDVSSDYQAGGIVHHIGYVISGTTNDGVYLVVQDCNKQTNGTYSCNGSNDRDYFLDTPAGQGPGGNWQDGVGLPGFSSRTFDARSTGTGATVLKDPLWYAAKWGGFQDDNGNGIPDQQEEWDADGDGNPDNYFLVTNALTLSQQLRETFTEITNRSATASAASLNSGAIGTQTRVYQAIFNTNGWTGELAAYGFDSNNRLQTTPKWRASQRLPGWAARNIVTVNSDDRAVPFVWSGTGIDATRRAQLHENATTAQAYLEYLRGDDRNEQRNGGTLRNRESLLGDIVSSAPIYIGSPRARYNDRLEDDKYSDFVEDTRKRAGVVYVGGNDGMLHAFRADRYTDPDGDNGPRPPERVDGSEFGQELFAFIPKTVFGNLPQLTEQRYAHRYYVDGSPNSNEVYVGGRWRTVLVGGLNSGGQGIYSLDVTNPETLGTSSFMWEINDRTVGPNNTLPFRDLGYTFSQPAIVRLGEKENRATREFPEGVWAAVFGNGYNNTEDDGVASTTGNAVLYIVNMENGRLLKAFDTGVGRADDPTGQGRPNGLATPTLIDVDGDRIVDHAYVGDLFGNVWKLDLAGSDPDEWKFSFGTTAQPQPFFVATDDAGNRQPITSRIEAARGQYGAGIMLMFGTGKYLEPNDKVILPRRNQTFYGLFDPNGYIAEENAPVLPPQISGRAELTRQSILTEFTLRDGSMGRTTSRTPVGTGRGWYMDLVSPGDDYQGERVVTNPIVRDDRVIFSTLIPNDDVCGSGGSSWVMILDLLTGKMLRQAQTDNDGDGLITDPREGEGGATQPGPNDPRPDENAAGYSGGVDSGIYTGTSGGRCVSDGCLTDVLFGATSNGQIDQRALRSVLRSRGRQSWRQIR